MAPKVLRFLAILFSVLLGGVFLLSAYTKLYPIEPFEYTFVEFGIGGWKASIFIARFFIGFEFACGILLLFNLWLRRFTIPLVAAVLVIFMIYLSIQIAQFGNKGNCGCFGNFFQFTPLEGIIKNIVMLALAAFVYAYHPGFRFRGIKIISLLLVLVSLAMPFILNPIDLNASQRQYSDKLNYKLDLDLLYTDEDNPPPKVELRQGKWIIAFFSLTCPHCRVAAKKLHVIKLRNPQLPIHMILNGKKENLQPFFDDTRAGNVSWSLFIGAKKFIRMAGTDLPEIDWVDNSVVIKKSDYFFLDQADIERWVNQQE